VVAEWDARPDYIYSKRPPKSKAKKKTKKTAPIPPGYTFAPNGPLGSGFYTANGLVCTNALRTSGIPIPAVHWRREWKAKGKGRHSLSEGSVDFFAFGFVPSRLGGDRKWSAMLQYTDGKTAKTRGSQRWYGRGSHCSFLSMVEYHSEGKVALNTPPEVSPKEFCPVKEDEYPEFEIGNDKGELVDCDFHSFDLKDEDNEWKLFVDRKYCLDLVQGEVGDEAARRELLNMMRGIGKDEGDY